MSKPEAASPSATRPAGAWTAEFPLVGPAGETVDLRRVFLSHGIASLPPMRVDDAGAWFEVTLPVKGSSPRTVRITQSRPGHGLVTVAGRPPSALITTRLMATVRQVLSLDQDLSPFYRLARDDPQLSWVERGAGRMVRSPTVFEDVVKTICTTNCAWSATTRMVNALVGHLGEKAPGAPAAGPYGRAFPTPAAMAESGDTFYKNVAGAGYRGAYLRALAGSVDSGEVDLEGLAGGDAGRLSDDEVDERLRALPGVGPYASAHIMLMLGRYSRLILDSWTRPTYARLTSGRAVKDATIERRFRRYGSYAGLAFWLFLTRDWLTDEAGEAAAAAGAAEASRA